MSARPLRPVPLVSRSRPVRQPPPPGWWTRRRVAMGLAAFSLAGLMAAAGGRVGLRLPSARPPAPPPPSSLAVALVPAVTATPRPTSTPTPRPTSSTPTATPTVTPTVAPSATARPAALDESIATSLVQRYYSLIEAHDLPGAYALLGAEWRGRQSYNDFAAGYRGTVHDTATVTASAAATKGNVHGYVVALDLSAQTSSRTQRYKGLYFVAIEGGQPRIISGELSPQ